MTSPLDSLPVWVQPKVKAMLEDLRERAAKAAELWGESAAEKKRSGFNEEEREFYAGQRHVMGNFAAFLRALPLPTRPRIPVEGEEKELCICPHNHYMHKQCPQCPCFATVIDGPAPSPPNAEQGEDEGVVKLTDDAEWAGECRKCDCLLCIHVVEERAALLACRERARELYVAICAAWPTNGITEALAKYAMAEAQADKVVGK